MRFVPPLMKIAAALCLSALGACTALSTRPNVGPCPLAGALYEAERVVFFEGPSELENVAYSAEIRDVRATCRYFDDNPIDVDVEIDVAFGKGPAASGDEHVFTYFVAVTRGGRALLAKEFFDVRVALPEGGAGVRRTFAHNDVTIPRADEGTSGENFEIVVGFQLTPAQLAFNRSRRSLLAPDL